MYRLEYLPSAMQDMKEIVWYISHALSNPTAANKIAVALIEVADKIPEFPYSNPAYTPIRPLKREYRKLLVQNYLLLYWVDEQKKVVTVARVVYAKRDYGRLLK